VVAAAALAAVALAACGGASTTSSKSPETSGDGTATVDVASGSLGNILVDSQGRTVYLFKKDSGPKSTCFGACTTNWPPLRAPGKPTVGAGVSENHSSITQDNTNGNTTADQATDVADVCVGPTGEDPITGTCSGLGASALHSESHSEANSDTENGSTERSSYLLAVELGGAPLFQISDPTPIALPPGCPEGASLLCVYLNQGESFVYSGGAGSHQEGLHLSVLRAIVGGEDLALGHVADAETLVENTGPACPPGATRADCVQTPLCPPGQHRDASGNCVDDQGPRGLADTGLDTLVAVAIALALMIMGANLVAWDRRRALI